MSSDSQRLQDFINQHLQELAAQVDLMPDMPDERTGDLEEQFNYVVARKWNPEDPIHALCIYTYGDQIQTGTMEDAQEFLTYVTAQADPGEQYHIYKVNYEQINI